MTWQQLVIAVLMILSFTNSAKATWADLKLTNAGAVILIAIALLVTVGEALVLHSGDFW